jgi:hypothetical protein
VDIDPGLDSTVGIVDDVVVAVANELLRDRRRDARRDFMEVFEKAQPAFAAAIVESSARQRAQQRRFPRRRRPCKRNTQLVAGERPLLRVW